MRDLPSLIRKNIDYYWDKLKIKARSARYILAPVSLHRPIFVVGCSRAGTTLIYKTFSESSQLGTLNRETHDFWAAMHPPEDRGWENHAIPEANACDQDRDHVSRFFYARTGQRRIVDKNNQNGLSIPYLLRLFPDAHFVFIKRSPGDNINSLIYGWAKSDEFGTWASRLPEAVSIDGGAYRQWCFFLADGWRQYTTSPIEDVCAFQYRSMNEAILQAKKQVPEQQWHEVCYETLIADPVGEFKRLFESCGLLFDAHLQRHCAEVIAKPYNAFSAIKVDKWKEGDNQERIERILPSVSTIAEKLGYPSS
jgi:hypothetical protein